MMGLTALLTAAALNLVHPAQTNLKNPVQVEIHREDSTLVATFDVQTPTINAKAELGPNEYPFQFDVVELFVSVDGDKTNLPYYEFELTPNNQTFEVKILGPKKRIDGVDMGAEYKAERTRTGWRGQIAIPLENLGWRGDPKTIVGNAYAVLGKRPHRTYWSLYLAPQAKPNFHLPASFKPLLKNEGADVSP